MNALSIDFVAIALVFAVGVASAQGATPSTANPAAPSACCPDSKAQTGEMDAHMMWMMMDQQGAMAAGPMRAPAK
jgi:hypothetical protein